MEEAQYRKFIDDYKVEDLRKKLGKIMKDNLYRTLGLQEKDNLTEYVYALRMTYDHVADILTPHVKTQDIVKMCKIYKFAS